MLNPNIIVSLNDIFIYNEMNDTYEYYSSGIKNDWIFVSNNKLYLKTDNKFEYLKESIYDKHIIYYQDDNFKIAVKDTLNIFIFNMHNNNSFEYKFHRGNVIQYEKIIKIDDNKYFLYNSMNIGQGIKIKNDKIKFISHPNVCLDCCLAWKNVRRIHECYSNNKNIYCYNHATDIIISPYTLLFGNHKSYVLCSVVNKSTGTINEYIITSMEKNICNDNNDILIMPVNDGVKKIMNICNINISLSKFFSRWEKIRDQNAFVFYDRKYGCEYFIYLNYKGECAVLYMRSSYDSWEMRTSYKDPVMIIFINTSLFPLGVIYFNVTCSINKYFLTILLIDGTYHEYIIDKIENTESCEYVYKKSKRPDPQLIKINNQDKFTVLNTTAKTQLKTFLLVLKHKNINMSKFLVRNIMELSLI